jgi:uncharacterized membrane protein
VAVGYVVVVGSLVGLSLVGTASGFNTMKGQQSSTLDGYAWLKSERPDQLALVDWINTHIQGQPRLLEAAGESYTQRSLISSYTGLIVPIGWASHEWGWRYSPTQWSAISARMGDVSTMYKTTDSTQLRQLVDKWNIDYIVASPVEMQEYALPGFETISRTYGEPVFVQGDYRLFQVN